MVLQKSLCQKQNARGVDDCCSENEVKLRRVEDLAGRLFAQGKVSLICQTSTRDLLKWKYQVNNSHFQFDTTIFPPSPYIVFTPGSQKQVLRAEFASDLTNMAPPSAPMFQNVVTYKPNYDKLEVPPKGNINDRY